VGKLLIISNRLPVSVEKRKGGLHYAPSVGGLAAGLAAVSKKYGSVWIGWPGIAIDKGIDPADIENELMSHYSCKPVFLSRTEIDNYYHNFCNEAVWPVFHYFTQYADFNETAWESYKRVNEKFSEIVLDIAEPDDIIWVHDYHLMLLPGLIRKKMPFAKLGFFLHIPFPSYEIFRLFPWREEILEGLLGSDVVGFHTYGYAQHFLNSVQRFLGYEPHMGHVTVADRLVKTDVFPIGIDYKRFAGAGKDPAVKKEEARLTKELGDVKVILSIDRLDYTKGIPQRIEAFDTFLEKNPQYKEKVVCILIVVPSRSQVERYKAMKHRVDELIGEVNGRHGTIGWTPIRYFYRFFPFQNLAAFYRRADICLVTPLRDGMNLIAKEYVSTRTDGTGVLILSEMAGAAEELGEAIVVNPNNHNEIVAALEKAISMPENEQLARNSKMRERMSRYNVSRWSEDFIHRLEITKELQKEMHATLLTEELREKLVKDYQKAQRRLIFLDYDGTLTPFAGTPDEARPDESLLNLIDAISSKDENCVVLISGRDRKSLDEWFGGLELDIVAEHGVWLKEKGREWEMIEPLTNGWKDEIRPILELHVDRTPGSFIEEKGFSLAWHYRKSDSQLGAVRASELLENLVHLTANLNLQVLEGNKVLDVKNSGINKGRAALHWVSKEKWDFIMAAGDDRTDEDIFGVLPNDAYSIKVGLRPSVAKYNLKSPEGVVSLLRELVK
jgi:trehalose 6-phosphate synthase/phosphatase